MVSVLDELGEVVDRLASVSPHELADAEALLELHCVRARLDAVYAGASAAFDASGDWAADGARSTAAWIAGRCHVPTPVARRELRRGRVVRSMPETDAAWRAGSITADHVSILAAAEQAAPEAFRRDEAELVQLAGSARWRRFVAAVAYWRQVNDPDGEEARAGKQVEDRSLHCSQSFQGAWFLNGTLDPIGGTIVSDTLRGIEQELFESDWREAKDRLQREPSALELRRTPAQRRADALVEMATRARTVPKGGRRPEPLFTVFVDYETFAGRLCQLANGAAVTPGTLVPWLDRAWAERVVFGPTSRVIDVGVSQRLFTGADRKAVVAAHLAECFHDLCDECGEHLQIDHAQPYAAGGPTIQDNGRPACATHNRRRNQRRRSGRPPRGP